MSVKLGPQHYAIIEYLKAGNTLTHLQTIKVAGSIKLSTRIGELEKKGYTFGKEWIITDTGKKVKKYWLISEPDPKDTPAEEIIRRNNYTIETRINNQAEFAGMGRVNYGV